LPVVSIMNKSDIKLKNLFKMLYLCRMLWYAAIGAGIYIFALYSDWPGHIP